VPYALYTNYVTEGLGSLGETLWHNGKGWVSTSQIFVDPNKVEVSAQEERIIEEPIFAVRNSNNEIVFAVYESGVVAYVASADETRGSRGGFAVGGLSDQGKSYTDWLRLNKDTTYIRTQTLNLNQNVWVDENVSVGGKAGTIPLTHIDENTYNTVRIGTKI